MKEKERKKKKPSPLYTSILLFLMAAAAVTAATMAWLSISDSARLQSINMDVTSGEALRMDLDPHEDFMEYVQTLTYQQIAERIQKEHGFLATETPLEPVTSSDFSEFTFEDGKTAGADSGVYLEFTLNFMSNKDMTVHLTSQNGDAGEKGTAVTSDNAQLPKAMRIAFTADGVTKIYAPGMGAQSEKYMNAVLFGLPAGDKMSYNDDNVLFSLKEEENKAVVVHVWLEGTDEACTDDLRGATYDLTLRFEGTDGDNQPF